MKSVPYGPVIRLGGSLVLVSLALRSARQNPTCLAWSVWQFIRPTSSFRLLSGAVRGLPATFWGLMAGLVSTSALAPVLYPGPGGTAAGPLAMFAPAGRVDLAGWFIAGVACPLWVAMSFHWPN